MVASVMAPLPNITGIHRVAFYWHFGSGGPTAINVMHFFGASVDPNGLRNALNSNVAANMWIGVHSGASIYQLGITPLDNSTATQIYQVSGANWTGQTAGGDYVPQVAGVVSLRTAVRGRQNRGRVFTPFINEAVISNGSFSGSLTSVQTAWDTFRTSMKTASWPLHVASYGHSLHKTKSSSGVITLTPVTWTPHSNEVITSTYETVLGTMRPRQGRLR